MTARPEKCGMPETSTATCELPWGHAGEFHVHDTLRFRLRDMDEEHRRRQKETGNLPKPTFHFSISYEVSYSVEELWPDGDAPENPTIDDVLAMISKCGGKYNIMRDWSMTDELDLVVSDDKTARNVP